MILRATRPAGGVSWGMSDSVAKWDLNGQIRRSPSEPSLRMEIG